ncbi:heme/hemin ABC transporter substrate-binding protein [Pseudomonas sp. TTU2014-080ASC]|uniref:heme/hemin ABC transporter substrate-binding protein n=1 Tax=Pseudomonas sp. TTU2014-080ASC TaxID=1729724 RepID=UPI000718875F|nr:ABC transporter substrate-binding protein [Pseudomonas sp. TTU2014-080ASC]KRW59256.1 ABC transporter substrate-binding protein [Pseudomonas sp. TTU2014-080ASC]
MKALNAVIAACASIIFSGSVQADEPLPQRWITSGGSLSEWVVELGGESRLVGVDSTSRHPETLTKLPSVGYQRQLAAEGILALRPDVVLGTEEMGPPPVLAQLRSAGVKVESLSSQPDLPSLHGTLQHVGELLGDKARAEQVFAAYEQRLKQQEHWVADVQQKQSAPGVVILIGHAGASPMAGGKNTVGDWLVARAGGRNLATHEGYKSLSTEALLGLNPDVVLIADRQLAGEAAQKALLSQNPALAATKAATEGRLLVIDPTLLVGGLGPRLPAALSEISAVFYPGSEPLKTDTKPAL